MTRDMLTYRFPRKTEAAFGCDANSAVAITRHRRPLQMRVADLMWACVWAGIFVCMVLYGMGALV